MTIGIDIQFISDILIVMIEVTRELKDLLDALEKQRQVLGKSRTQFAAELGVTENYIQRLRMGDRKPGVEFLGSILTKYPGLNEKVHNYTMSRSRDNGSPESNDDSNSDSTAAK